MLLRVFRYRESLAETDALSLYEAELELPGGEPDLQLSVYDAPLDSAEQVVLEHFAHAKLDPPRHGTVVNVAAARSESVPERTDSPFSFTREAHRYIPFQDRNDQLSFAADVVGILGAPNAPNLRSRSFEKSRLRAWLAARVAHGDGEWSSFLASASDKWKKYPKAG